MPTARVSATAAATGTATATATAKARNDQRRILGQYVLTVRGTRVILRLSVRIPFTDKLNTLKAAFSESMASAHSESIWLGLILGLRLGGGEGGLGLG